jgi:hypothetical protein
MRVEKNNFKSEWQPIETAPTDGIAIIYFEDFMGVSSMCCILVCDDDGSDIYSNDRLAGWTQRVTEL